MCRETGSFLSLPSHTCGVSGPEPTSLHSTGTRIRGLCCSVWCKCRHSAAPWDRAAWGFFFPPKPVIFWVWKEKSKADSLPIKAGAGRADVLIYSALQLFIKAHSVRQPAEHLFCLPHLDLHFVCYMQHPGAAVSPVCPEQMCSQEDLYLPRSVWDICHAGIPFMGISGDLEEIVCFSLKRTYSGAQSVWLGDGNFCSVFSCVYGDFPGIRRCLRSRISEHSWLSRDHPGTQGEAVDGGEASFPETARSGSQGRSSVFCH